MRLSLAEQRTSQSRPTIAPNLNKEYNQSMALGLLGMHILEVMFFTGMAGSAIVIVLSFIEDIHELFGEDEEIGAR